MTFAAFTLQLAAIFCTGLFAGAALYVSLVEHPARMKCGTALATAEFGPSYRRATVMQALLAVAGGGAAFVAWWSSSDVYWLIGGVLITAVVPFTLIVMLPTNRRLLDKALDPSSPTAHQLLQRWSRLHAVRTIFGIGALLVFLLALLPVNVTSLRYSREATLKQDLFVLRELISQYTLDKKEPPQSLEALVQAGYIKKIPIDPLTGRTDTWVTEHQHFGNGIISVHSGSGAIGINGMAYNTW